MKKPIYKGFSFSRFELDKSFNVSDVELVKLNILSHIFTRKGERVKMSNFGTRIPDLVFEPLDGKTIAIVEEDITYVLKYDPRVKINTLEVIPLPDENTIVAIADLNFVELNLSDTLHIVIEFEG